MSEGIGTDYPEPTEAELDPYADDPIDENTAAAQREQQRLLSLVRPGDWLDAQEFPPMRWSVPGLIPQGFGLFTGPPKVGKSWATLAVGLAVACGGRALGKVHVGSPRPVLYLALEDGDSRLQWRSRQLLQGEPIPANLHTVTRVQPKDVISLIAAWLDEHGRQHPLVLLDTLGRVMPPAHPGEGAYQRDYRIGTVLKDLADSQPGCTVMVVHHVRKQGAEDWMDSTSGTNGLNGAADFTLNVHRRRGEDRGLLRVTGRDTSDGEYAATFQAGGRWVLDGSDLQQAAQEATNRMVTDALGDQTADIVTFVGRHPDGVRAGDVAKVLDIDPKKASTYLQRLYEAERLRKPKRGLYAPIPAQDVLVDDDDPPSRYVESVGSVGNTPSETHTSNTSNTGVGGPTEDALGPPATGVATSATPQQTCAQCGDPMPYAEPGETNHPTCTQENS